MNKGRHMQYAKNKIQDFKEMIKIHGNETSFKKTQRKVNQV